MFDVFLNDEIIDSIQSLDDMGNWHVAFRVEPTSQGILKISGFEEGLPLELSKIPQWVKLNGEWWITNQISDSEFLKGVDFLIEKQIISFPNRDVTLETEWNIPSWVKITVKWWHEEKISDDDFLNLVENLVTRNIIVI